MSVPTVAEVMTTDVVTVIPATPFKEVVGLLAEHRVSAVPVVDEDHRPIGVVSEADILVKEAHPGEFEVPGMLAGRKRWRRWTQVHATTCADVMTHGVATIAPGESLTTAARRLSEEKLRRLFVVDPDSGRLVGVLARRDLIRVYLRSDEELAECVRRDVLRRVLWVGPNEVTVGVSDGEVTLEGALERAGEVELAEQLVAQVPGVVAVHNKLTYFLEDADGVVVPGA